MNAPSTTREVDAGVDTAARLEDMYQVVLFNDDHNSMEHVVLCLQRIFAHPEPLAIKIMLEAHENGKAIAEVEAETEARLHVGQLQSSGLTATMERF